MNGTGYTRIKVCVSIATEGLAKFDEWARENRLPRGAAMVALVRMVRELSRGVPAEAAFMERTYEMDPSGPT